MDRGYKLLEHLSKKQKKNKRIYGLAKAWDEVGYISEEIGVKEYQQNPIEYKQCFYCGSVITKADKKCPCCGSNKFADGKKDF